MPSAEIHLENIQSMLAAGHRSLHLERHTLLLWGGVGGLLCAGSDYVVNNEIFPDLHQHAFALLLWLAFWIIGTAWLDQRLTRRARRDREETLPFAQAQITRAWWMLLSMGVLGSCAMFFYGGSIMVYALWTVLLGLGIYLFGLFSRPLTEWIGLAIILLGVTGLAAGLSFETTRWLAATCFAIGMPLAGWMVDRNWGVRLPGRLLALIAWLLAVVLPALWIAQLPPAAPQTASNARILTLPAGTVIPIKFELDSTQIKISPEATLPIILNQALEVVISDDQPDGRYRFDQSSWGQVKNGSLQLRIDRMTPTLEAGKPVIRTHVFFQTKEARE